MHGVLNRQLQINGNDIMAELHRTGELGKLLRCDPVARGAN
ncbi:MAG: hypothetical protein ABIA75_12110 [Candidatus Neomarinimicrobiota bacterium]